MKKFEIRVTRPTLNEGSPVDGRQGHYFNSSAVDDPAIFGLLVTTAQIKFRGEELDIQLWNDPENLYPDFQEQVLRYNGNGRLMEILGPANCTL